MTPDLVEESRSGEAGFTFVEAMAAIIILMFGLAAIANLYVVATQSNLAASQSTAAVNMASQQMENFRAMPFENIAQGGDLDNDVPLGGCGNAGAFCRYDVIPGVGEIRTRWLVSQLDPQTWYVRVRSESTALLKERTRVELTTFRTCAAVAAGCPPLGP